MMRTHWFGNGAPADIRIGRPFLQLMARTVGCVLLMAGFASKARASDVPPEPIREFRAFWVVTLPNHDWPSEPGLSPEQQRAEMIRVLNWAKQLRMNAVILQVRSACDAIYSSKYEPWAESLSGQMGKPPDPVYDPLRFAIDEAHRRGLELHAWFNPFRARHVSSKGPVSSDHVSRTHPEWVRKYNGSLWLDPGEREARLYSLRIILDVVNRYDVDGVHLDDYFYPYKDAKKSDFPDDLTWSRYRESGGELSRDDWRRDNVNRFVHTLYREIKMRKPRVKFGISPFGIWRPGHPPQIKGKDSYEELYADSFKWFANGWVDYLSPQLYWKIDDHDQSYPVLLAWWAAQNFQNRHLWPGNMAAHVESRNWPPTEIARQILTTRKVKGASGNVLFRAGTLMNTKNGLANTLLKYCYQEPALVPDSPWLNHEKSGLPKVSKIDDARRGMFRIRWSEGSGEKPWLWVYQTRRQDRWTTEILPAGQRQRNLPKDSLSLLPDLIAVRAVTRSGNLSEPRVISIKSR